MRTLRYCRAAALSVVLMFLCGVGWGQQLATLNGTVQDPTGAVVPRVQIRLVNVETGESYGAATNDSGNYMIPLVKPGRYELTAESAGFKQYRQTGIVLETAAPGRVDITLQLGVLAESVSVEATVPLLKTESSSVGLVVQNLTIRDMPLVDRRAAQLARLSGFMVQVGGPNFAMAGGRGGNAMWFIDGGSIQNMTLGDPYLVFDPPIEALQEFNVAISNYAAEMGRTGGGVVQMTTRSGTNKFHGSAYEYLRNDALDARNFFAASKPKLRYNLFGASLGGPIRKDRTHFFYNYEGQRVIVEATRIINVPSPAETRGDFSASGIVIRDPAAPGRPPFPNNVIPPSRLDPVGAKLASFYPEPNVPGRPSGSSNFRKNQPLRYPSNTHMARVDHVFSNKDRAYGTFIAATNSGDDGAIFPTPEADPFHRRAQYSYFNATGTWFHNFSPTLINEFRLSWDRRKYINRGGGTDTTVAQQLGIKGVNPRFFPTVNVAGLAGLGYSEHERLQVPIRSDQLVDNVTLVRGNHTLKSGIQWRRSRNDDVWRGRGGGLFGFNNTATASSLASLLLGWTNSGSIWETLPIRSRANSLGAFVQDDWKVAPKLTLNLGLRWDVDQPRWEGFNNRQNSFDRFAINPVSGTPGIVRFSGRGGLSKFAHNHDWNNFGPRLGFAWRVKEKWVIRGGGAILYTGQYDQATPLAVNLGFSRQGDFVSPDNGLTPAFLLRDGLPPMKEPTEADLTPAFGAVPVGQSTIVAPQFFEPTNRRNGYLEQFNLNVQRQFFGNVLVEIGYLATLAHKLTAPGTRGINQVLPAQMGPGNAQIRRPFPQFSDVRVVAPDIGNSNYHGLNLKLEKRYSRGLHFQANYTWSRFIDDAEARAELGGNPGVNAYANYYDRAADRGLSGNHISHRLIWSSVWEVPVGKGRILNLGSPVWNQIFGGWSTGFIAELRTGPPWGVIEQVNTTNSFSDGQRPNVVGNPKISGNRSRAQQIERWFDTSAFAAPAPFTFGNAGRTSGYGPGAIDMDLSILKDFPTREGQRLQFRCEMLKFINRPNFALPTLLRGNPAFGRITGAGGSRVIQLGLHYKF